VSARKLPHIEINEPPPPTTQGSSFRDHRIEGVNHRNGSRNFGLLKPPMVRQEGSILPAPAISQPLRVTRSASLFPASSDSRLGRPCVARTRAE
jgi:hypothetical protein